MYKNATVVVISTGGLNQGDVSSCIWPTWLRSYQRGSHQLIGVSDLRNSQSEYRVTTCLSTALHQSILFKCIIINFSPDDVLRTFRALASRNTAGTTMNDSSSRDTDSVKLTSNEIFWIFVKYCIGKRSYLSEVKPSSLNQNP